MEYNLPSEIVKDLTFGDSAKQKIIKGVDKLSEAVLQLDERVVRRLKDLEEFTGLYNDNEIEDARTSEQIKSDVKKRRQNEKS